MSRARRAVFERCSGNRGSLIINAVDSSLVSAALKIGGEPSVDDGDRFFFGHLALADGDHVAVSVLFGEAGSPLVPDHRTSNPAKPVCHDRLVPASAHEDTKGMLTRRNGLCRGTDKRRVVNRGFGIGAEVLNFHSLCLKMTLQGGLEFVSRVVAGYGNAWHGEFKKKCRLLSVGILVVCNVFRVGNAVMVPD